jgi:uncharacterized PurR-regulated membrane protein YhhQ (DUF165 family)
MLYLSILFQSALGFVFSCLPTTMQQYQDLKFNSFKNIFNLRTRIAVISGLIFRFMVWDETIQLHVGHNLAYCIAPADG